MTKTKRKIPDRPKKRLKWRLKRNYTFYTIVGGLCLITALILIYEINLHLRTRHMEAVLQKSRRDMHWGGITDQDVEVLKKIYPGINWDHQYDRERWQKGVESMREKRAKEKAGYKSLRGKRQRE